MKQMKDREKSSSALADNLDQQPPPVRCEITDLHVHLASTIDTAWSAA